MPQRALKQGDIVKLDVPAFWTTKVSNPNDQFIVSQINKNIFRMIRNAFLHFVSDDEQYNWVSFIKYYEIELYDNLNDKTFKVLECDVHLA